MADEQKIDERGIVSLLKNAAESLSQLVADHLRLARVELADDVKEELRRVGLRALAVSFLLLGYGLACIAAALALARWITVLKGFLVVSAANVLAGVVVLSVTSRRLRTGRLLHETTRELRQTANNLTARIG